MGKKFQAEVLWKNPNILRPYEQNAKKHPKEQIAKIAKSIDAHGFDVPIVVDGNNVIIKGHGRTLAAIQLGMEVVPVVVRKDLTETQIRAARIADNQCSKTDYDDDILKLELEELNAQGIDMTLTGFDPEELQKLMAISISDLPSADGEEEKPKGPRVAEAGDVWRLGEHELTVGNFKENPDVDKAIREWQRFTKMDAILDSTGQTFYEIQESKK